MVKVISSPFSKQRNLEHRQKKCECFECYAQWVKAPPFQTAEEENQVARQKAHKRDLKRARAAAKKEVKSGQQSTINSFFGVEKKQKKKKKRKKSAKESKNGQSLIEEMLFSPATKNSPTDDY